MFEFSKLVDVILRPSFLILLVCSLGLLCSLMPWTRAVGRRLMILGTLGILLASLPPAEWPMAALEDRFPEPELLPGHVDGVIVLGGAIDLGISADRLQPTLKGGADRMTTFLALARYYPNAKLVFTGGSAVSSGQREADIARDLFAGLGLDPGRVIFESRSRNTRENALLSKQLAEPLSGETWLLVTSAADMPRAVGCFRGVGWVVTAWPVSYRVLRDAQLSVPNLPNGLANLDWAIHEWIGLAYYHLQGWTDAWFPGPQPDAAPRKDGT